MPYTIDNPPERIKDLPKHAQEIWIATFNSAIEQYKDEGKANATAWAAVKKQYEQDEEGKWIKKEERSQLEKIAVILNAEFIGKVEPHDAILQTLNRELNYGSKTYYFPVKAFEDNVNEWNGTPIVFAPEHPDLKLFSTDPEKALKAVNGKIVGKVRNPRIEVTGHPRLMATLLIDDPEVEKLNEEGKLSPSTAFIGASDGKGNIIKVEPNHVLVFEENGANKPRDKGAFLLNQYQAQAPTENQDQNQNQNLELENVGKVLSKENEGIIQRAIETLKELLAKVIQGQGNRSREDKEKEKEVEDQKKDLEEKEMEEKERAELTSQIEVKDKEMEKLKIEVVELKAKLEESVKETEQFKAQEEIRKKAERDAQWTAVKSKFVPEGMVHKPEDELKLKDEFDKKPHEFMAKLTTLKHREGTEEEGAEFTGMGDNVQTSIGAYNPEKKVFEQVRRTG